MKISSIEIVKILQEAGFTTYWAGGCVRDILLQKEPQDFDIATSAKVEEVEDLLEKTYPIGREFGVILTENNGHHFEIATFRKEGEYLDGRRPQSVEFCAPEEDAKRRDFTINGMFYDPITDQLYDYVDGEKDLKEKLIKFIGDPHQRIEEDHLRLIRAIRFKNILEFQYDPQTYQAIQDHAKLSAKVSGERLKAELNKMIMSKKFIQCLADMHDTGVLNEILPEFSAMKGTAQPFFYHREGDVWNHSLQAYEALSPEASLELKWATILHDIAKPITYSYEKRIRFDEHAPKSELIAKELLKRLHFSRKDIDHIIWLTSHHMMMGDLLDMPEGRVKHWFLHPWFPELLELFRVDIAGTDPSIYQLYNRIQSFYEDFIQQMKIKNTQVKPLLDGRQIMELIEIPAGPKLGEIIEHLREKQLEHKINNVEEASVWVKELYGI